MNLDEITSPEQLRAALAKGDPELEKEIEREVSRNIDRAWQDPNVEEIDPDTAPQMVTDAHLDSVMELFHDSELLAPVPRDRVLTSLREEVQSAAESIFQSRRRGGRSAGSKVVFFATGSGRGVTLQPVYLELRVRFDFDEPLAWVPSKLMLKILKEQGPLDTEWEEIDEGDYSSGWVESGDYWRLEVDAWEGFEWVRDLRTEYLSEMVDAGPEQAISELMRLLKQGYPELAKKLRKAKLPKDVLADYAVAFFEDADTGIEAISQAVGVFGYEGTRGEVLLEVDKAALRELGIRSGRWWDSAPWRLINLPVEELLYEGTLQRHCVGRRDMGYHEAVERGDTQIWSLRSRHQKPILTFEVDMHEWQSTDPAARGGAIDQLKGKLNRLAGRDPDEALVLHWIFAKLGVDPRAVGDFVGTSPDAAPHENPGFNAPWRPYLARRRDSLLRWH